MTAFSIYEIWHFYCSSISFHTEVNGSTEKKKKKKAKQIMNACHNGFAV